MKRTVLLCMLLLLFILPATGESEWSIETVSPKFRVELELYASVYNPASFGFIDHDTFHFWIVQSFSPPAETDLHGGTQLVDGYYLNDKKIPHKIGYVLPLGHSLGFGAEFVDGGYDRMLMTPFWFNDYQGTPNQSIGGIPRIQGGAVSLGLSLLTWYSGSGDEEWAYITDDGF